MKKILPLVLFMLLLTACAEAETDDANLYLAAYREYDAGGAVTLERTYDVDGKLLSESAADGTVEYTYGDGVTEKRTYDADGGLVEWLDTEYNEYGSETAFVTRDPSTGEETSRVEIVYSNTSGSTIEEHYLDGALVYFCRHIAGDSKVQSEYRQDGWSWYTTDYYDGRGNVTMRQYVAENNSGSHERFYEYRTYDRDERLTEVRIEISLLPIGRLSSRVKDALSDGIEAEMLAELGGFENTYDRKERLAERVHYDRDGEPYKTTVFTYDDYGNLVGEETTRADGTLESTAEYVYLEIPE